MKIKMLSFTKVLYKMTNLSMIKLIEEINSKKNISLIVQDDMIMINFHKDIQEILERILARIQVLEIHQLII